MGLNFLHYDLYSWIRVVVTASNEMKNVPIIQECVRLMIAHPVSVILYIGSW